MRDQWNRTAAKTLAALCAALCLGGCTAPGGPAPSQSGAPKLSISQELTGLPPEEVLFSVDGIPVSNAEYSYWLVNSMEVASAYHFNGGDIVWTEEVDGVPVLDYVKKDSMEAAKYFALVKAQAAQHNVVLTQEDEDTVEQNMANYVTQMGELRLETGITEGTVAQDLSTPEREKFIQEEGAKALDERCRELGTSVEDLREMERITLLHEKLGDALFGEGGSMAPTQEELNQWIDQQALYKAKHILISNKDADGNDLSQEEQDKAKKRAEELLAQLLDSDDPLPLFDQLMAEHSEDPGSAYYPEGYTFTDGDMVEEFTNGVKALKENEISDVITSSFGYHIILRLSPLDDSVREQYAAEAFFNLGEKWLEEAEVEETAALAQIDLQAVAAKLKQIRLENAPSPSPSQEAAPAASPDAAPAASQDAAPSPSQGQPDPTPT